MLKATYLTARDWSLILDALHYASEEVGYDLYDTRNSDFYSAEDREIREQQQRDWDRLAALIIPMTNEVCDDE